MDYQKLYDEFQETISELSVPLNKQAIFKKILPKFKLKRDRSVYYNESFAIRFSEIKKKGYSNTYLSLRQIRKYNSIPLIACIVRPKNIELLLSNLTFIKKISHSSHILDENTLRGSANLSNIFKEYVGIPNEPSNFDTLFELHQKICIDHNIRRIIAATNGIVATGKMFSPNETERKAILKSVERAKGLSKKEYLSLKNNLDDRVETIKDKILRLSESDNVNIRGNSIEQLITGQLNEHNLDDILFDISGVKVYIDVKTKIINLHSNPKAYNLDKLLKILSIENTIYCIYFVFIDREKKTLDTTLHSFLNSVLLDHTRIQFHWAGRNSRGAAQFAGEFVNDLVEVEYPNIDEDKALNFIRCIIGKELFDS